MKLKQFFSLLIYAVEANLRTEIERYYLNYLWWIIEPILLMGIFYVVFGVFLSRNTDNFVGFLLCGLVFWNWFARSVQNASSSIYLGRDLMLQLQISKLYFPLEVILRDAFKQTFVIVLLMVFLFFYLPDVHITWLALPLLLIIQFLYIAGFAIIGAAIVPFIHDIKFVISTGLQLMFFGSGIFYDIKEVTLPVHEKVMYMNPIAGLIDAYREILMKGNWPEWGYMLNLFLGGLFVLVLSIVFIRKYEYDYPQVCQR